jgi:hypothetical protein
MERDGMERIAATNDDKKGDNRKKRNSIHEGKEDESEQSNTTSRIDSSVLRDRKRQNAGRKGREELAARKKSRVWGGGVLSAPRRNVNDVGEELFKTTLRGWFDEEYVEYCWEERQWRTQKKHRRCLRYYAEDS